MRDLRIERDGWNRGRYVREAQGEHHEGYFQRTKWVRAS